jgi:hypothetical protein
MSAAPIIARLDRVRESGPGTWRARCPACDSRSDCLSIRELDDGRVLMHCFRTQCEPGDILRALGLSVSELFPQRPNDHRYRPAKSLMPAREALALIDHEVTVATLIISDVLRDRTVTDERYDRLSQCYARIADARTKSCPARLSRGAA